MASPEHNPQEVLCEEILAEARRESEEILNHARQEAESLLAQAKAEAQKERQEKLDAARAEAARRRALILSSIPVETGRLRSSRIEALLQSIHGTALRQLPCRDHKDSREMLIALAAEAIREMAGNSFVVKLAPADSADFSKDLAQEILQRCGRESSISIRICEEPSISSGGVIVADQEGHQIWDNRLESRLERLWPELRRQIAIPAGLATCEDQTSGGRCFAEGLREAAEGKRTSAPGPPRRGHLQNTVSAEPRQPVVTRVSGPVVTAVGMAGAQMYEVVHVGELNLVGEVIRLIGDRATIQVYEDTTMLKPGAPIQGTGAPLSVWLGPGLIGNIYDGIQRPLPAMQARSGPWIQRGEKVNPLDASRRWRFQPTMTAGETVAGGQTIGHVEETPLVRHRILIPPDLSGTVRSVAPAGDYALRDPLAVIATPAGEREVTMLQQWPVRQARPIRQRLRISKPLVTGQRIIDTFFPIGKGGAAAIPGGFGTGKTITQHQLAKWSDAEIIVFIGCGERGNEMTEVLREFPELKDPRTGRPLMERTILIANTSNMPVAAREVSIYTGITLAEYYRDMGLNVAVFADSTSRWAEALRELAARLEEMPAEEGFPATLPTRLAQFYERGGAVTTLGGEPGSVSIVGAVSPPGGDFSEPVTQHTRRFIRCFWALDTELANARHYPSIHWLRSYSEYVEDVSQEWEKLAPDWSELRAEALALLQREERLQQIVKLVGPDVLPEAQRLILFVAELLKDGFLAQSAFDEKDMFCAPERQLALLQIIMTIYRKGRDLVQAGVALARIRGMPCVSQVVSAKFSYGNDEMKQVKELEKRVVEELDGLANKSEKSHG